jgi:ABC-type multidrug transport system ATPase subunit
MMDEPTASLDSARRSELGGLLTALSRENRTILVSTHDEDFVREFAGSVLRLEQGRVMGRDR